MKGGDLQATHSEYGRQHNFLRLMHLEVPDHWYWKAQKHYIDNDMRCRRAYINRKRGNMTSFTAFKVPKFVNRNALKYCDK